MSKRNESKRRRDDTTLKKREESSSSKRAKIDVAVEDVKPTKVENNDTKQDDITNIKEDAKANEQQSSNEVKVEGAPSSEKNIQDEIIEEEEEDPEEDAEMAEEDEEMAEATVTSPRDDVKKEARSCLFVFQTSVLIYTSFKSI